MPGFGTMLGAFGNAYPQYQQQQLQHQMGQQQLKEALQRMAVEQQTRRAYQDASTAAQNTQPSGPGGTYSPQELIKLSQGNPDVLKAYTSAFRPNVTGAYNVEGRQVSGEYGLDRAQMTGDNAMQRVQAQQKGALERAQMGDQTRRDIVAEQQKGADTRNQRTVSARKSSATNPVNLASLPEFKTAKSEFEEAKKDERNIEAHYPSIAQAYNDPQWLDARKRAVAAQKKMESIQSKAAKEAPAQKAEPVPLPAEMKDAPDGTTVPDSDGNVWIKQGDKLIPQ